ncbi:hypothetical protein HQN89_17880 [Paenibacillus frigoriresistens]|uniref:hypothetical protein n=1 Tax=Paenibacillus alginolyticus TaxID=59839 RepID=UPI001565C381|nr:hypothetical protein [Paenibacillus frigoriresistens]NRF92860.1 hypothetical protein [Paenibacillus frigoriresistens]
MRKKINVWMAIVLLFGMIAPQLLVTLEAAASGSVVLSQSFEDGQTGGWVKVPWMGDGSVAITSATLPSPIQVLGDDEPCCK